MNRMLLACLTAGLLGAFSAPAREIDFVEDFSLAEDRSTALKQLIPGTEDFYYYSALHAQNSGRTGEVASLLGLWVKRYGYTPRVQEIRYRQALLDYPKDPLGSLAFIRKELGLQFDHRRVIADRKTDFPVRLDPALIAADALFKGAFSRHQNMQGLEDAALERVPAEILNAVRRRDLLNRLRRPDYPDLPALVVDDLKEEHSGGFGSLPIHGLLLPAQLEECVRLLPELASNTAFVHAYAARLAPGEDVDIRSDREARLAYLERLVTYTRGLPPAFNSMKVHALYRLLEHERQEGRYPAELFLEYIKLPRQVHYIRPEFVNLAENRNVAADLNADFRNATRLPPVHVDEELVRDYLSRLFLNAAGYAEYAPYIRDDYLQRLFVETKIVNGIGDMEKWFSMMPPDAYQALKDRVDLDFAASNRLFYAADEPVRADLFVKNAGNLVVKVYEVNAFNYYRTRQREIDLDMDLDGLVATHEQSVRYDDPPLRRVGRAFPLPACAKPGVYVVEFIGNGRSSRALICKGQLHATERAGAAGHELRVFDEANRPCPEATVWLGGKEFAADAKGVILLPYSTSPGTVNLVLKAGDRCSLQPFRHQEEKYELNAGFYVDREALVKGNTATVLVRPVLLLNGQPVSLKLLTDVRLIVRAVKGPLMSETVAADFSLAEDRESVFAFSVPEFSNFIFELKGKVRNLSRQRDDELACSDSYDVNGMDKGLAVEQLLAKEAADGFTIELRGKNGEPKGGRPVHVELKHRWFRDTVHAPLQTDAEGRLSLGRLEQIDWFKATGPDGQSRTWNVPRDEATPSPVLHGVEGEVLRVPFFAEAGELPARQVSLLEKRGGVYAADRLENVRFREGFLELEGLPAGDYELHLKKDKRAVTVRVARGPVQGGLAFSRARTLERPPLDPLQIVSAGVTGDTLRVRLANVTPFTRLHVLATAYLPAYWIKGRLDYPAPVPGWTARTAPESVYVAGRNIGDEQRYVLERKYAEKGIGNMLERPSLLLAPWSLRETETDLQAVLPGDALRAYGGRAAGRRESALGSYGGRGGKGEGGPGEFANLDFLKEPAVLLANLRPDSNGVVTVERKALGAHPFVRLVAVDPFAVVSRRVALEGAPIALRDQRLAAALEAGKPFTEQKTVTVLHSNGVLRLKDLATAEFNLFDDIGKAHGFLSALGAGPQLAEFAFITEWPGLAVEKKRELYGKYACHELNFFLYHKDRAFFDAVILPFLKNKKDKTFLDAWLTGADLAPWAGPPFFQKLNMAERALLAKRGAADPAGVGRHLAELADLTPFDPEDYNRRFDTGLQSASLETADEYGFAAAREEALDAVTAPKPVPSAAPAAPPPAPMAAAAGDMSRMIAKSARKEVQAESEEKAKAEVADGLFDARMEDRKRQVQLFRVADKTKEWAENNYYKRPVAEMNADLVPANPFWTDYAKHDGKGPFLSPNLLYASSTFTEAMLALAVLDLPFKSADHAAAATNGVFTLTASGSVIAFHREIKEGQPAEEKTPVLVSQNYFRADDRYRFEGNERFDKFVTDEFLGQTAYGCQVVLVNPTSSRLSLRLLMQIPQGALPLQDGFQTRGVAVILEPFKTWTFDYYFYFPQPGLWPHYPVQVAKEERFVAGAAPFTLNVVEKLSKLDTESWDYVSQNAEPEAFFAFLEKHNLNRLDLEKAAWRMKDKAFFERTIAFLRARQAFHPTLWSYGLVHNAPAAASEFLQNSEYANRCGLYLDSPLLKIDPVERGLYQHLEYQPLIHARAHQLGRKRTILNESLYGQYHGFLRVLACKARPDSADWLAAAYYLLLQDRVSEATRAFGKVDAAKLQTRMQLDYFRVVLAFYKGDTAGARAIAEPYRDYPVPRWGNLFREALAQLDEVDGRKVDGLTDKDDRVQAQTRAAAEGPELDFKAEARKITLFHRNIATCTINYYPMDIELLFSRDPFAPEQADRFSFVRPVESQSVTLAVDRAETVIDLPKRFHGSNLIIEALAGGVRRTTAYYAHALNVQISEPFGQVRVADESGRKALPGVYVKVYARMKGGQVAFFKDGYTDLRGRFDYASLSTDELDRVERFSILVLSSEAGAVIREAAPPQR